MVAWKVQAQVASVAYIGLAAFCPLWIVLPAMLVWAGVATLVYCFARRHGFPDLLASHALPATHSPGCIAKSAASFLGKTWLAGFQAFLFSRASRPLIEPCKGRRRRLVRLGVLVLGLTLFGVTTAEHLLMRAGYKGDQLVQFALVGAFLNVTYRTLVGVAVFQVVWGASRALSADVTVVGLSLFRIFT